MSSESGFLFVLLIYFSLKFLFIFRERRREGERERNSDVREKHLLVASHTPLTRDLAHNPCMSLDWESNRQSV